MNFPKLMKSATLGATLTMALMGSAFAAATHPVTGETLAENQVLRMRLLDGIPSLDPQLMEDVTGFSFARDLFEGLLNQDADGNLVPGVAESWSANETNDVYTFNLRHNAKWSNGDPVTAHDFVYAWQRSVDPELASPYSWYVDLMSLKNASQILSGEMDKSELGVRAVDDYTFEVSLTAPLPYFASMTVLATVFPVHKATIETHGAEWTRPENMVSNGAYKLTEWVLKERTVRERNPMYWNNEATIIDRVETQVINDENVAFTRYLAGELDTTAVPSGQFIRLKKERPDETLSLPYLGSYYYSFNMDASGPEAFKDVRVRQALSYAVDRNVITDNILQGGQRPAAEALMARLKAAFGDRLYVELQRHPEDGGQPEPERLTERGFVEMAYAMDIPLVATNDVYFPKPDMYEAHDALICISEGAYVDQQQPRRRLTAQHYFKSQAEMATLFADLPEALSNTVEIAKRCAFMAYRRDPILPKFADDEVAELRRMANEGLQARLAVIPHAVSVEEYQKRLDFELGIIEGMGFPGYFLIVADFIKWAKDQDIPVGPGRGSGAGSLVAYALTITDLDPLRYSLLFERFLNPERVSMPDFDIDFCMDRREEVIRYVQEKYGRDKVGQIITFGALLSKAAVRDIGRVLQMPYGQVDRLSKMIPVEGVKPVSIEKALADEPRLREEAKSEEVVDRLLKYGQQVEGLLRNASTHAAGVVIGDRPLDALVPLYQDPRSDMPATQFNMKWVEQAGLVKFDFLGLKTLTVIQNAVDQIKASGRHLHLAADGSQLFDPPAGLIDDIGTIPLDDEESYKLYAAAKTVAVFQVESSGMMDALKRMRPTCIEDIVALVALYRPGPMENIPTYCEVKNGKRDRESVHPLIDDILEETQGIIVYQEQVMQ
ncbi:DNA polymerase III subunit alpha, partial [uncultured Maritalea sp.]|uniref:DNA polymerase III subunit alpha n=1 Tax=uncultured Maritalea sp. TaxID=757249 RepID=UPI0026298B8F